MTHSRCHASLELSRSTRPDSSRLLRRANRVHAQCRESHVAGMLLPAPCRPIAACKQQAAGACCFSSVSQATCRVWAGREMKAPGRATSTHNHLQQPTNRQQNCGNQPTNRQRQGQPQYRSIPDCRHMCSRSFSLATSHTSHTLQQQQQQPLCCRMLVPKGGVPTHNNDCRQGSQVGTDRPTD